MPALRRILPIAVAISVAAGPVAPAAVAGTDGGVHCGSHVDLVHRLQRPFWYAVLTVRNVRPHAATVFGGWEVRTINGSTTLHRQADLGGDDSQRFRILVQVGHGNAPPTAEVLSCR
jgi:hypothetical protein